MKGETSTWRELGTAESGGGGRAERTAPHKASINNSTPGKRV